MKTYFLTYSDDRFGYRGGKFRARQEAMIESARKHGIEHFKSWTWEDLTETDFYREHKEYLDKNRFHNGAVFKPFIVLDLLEKIDTGDIVFYHDSGPNPITTSVQPLIDLCVKNRGTVFHQWGDHNRMWAKRDAFYYMNCDNPSVHEAVALQNTWFLLQKSNWSLQFAREWLHYNLDERIASYVKPDECGLPPLKDFVENRGDQAIFSLLATKFGIKSFYGRGAEENKSVNRFMQTIPKNPVDWAYWIAVEIRRKKRRQKYVADYIADNKINYLRADIPAIFRESCYTALPQAAAATPVKS